MKLFVRFLMAFRLDLILKKRERAIENLKFTD